MASNRFLLAYLSRFQARDLFAELMKDFRGPTITPRFDYARAFPVQRIRQQKAGRIPQVFLLMHNHQPLTPVAFEPHDFGKDPVLLALPIATAHRHWAETFGMLLPEGRRHYVDPLPLPIPLDMPRAFDFADPVLAHTLNVARQVEGQYPIIEGIVGLGKVPLLFHLLHHL